MKGTGIVRRIDDLGRVVIPKSVRETVGLNEDGVPVEFFTHNNSVVLKRYVPDAVDTTVSTTFLGMGTVIVTEDFNGELYVITAEYFNDILNDWNGECNFVPANDAPVFFAAYNGKPINPYCYRDFSSLLEYMKIKNKLM